MIKYHRSICSTCRHLAACSLTTNKGFITYCCDYEHEKQAISKPCESTEEEDSYEELIFI